MPVDSDRKTVRASAAAGPPAGTPVDAAGAFTVERGVLRARHDLYWESLEEFKAACGKLLSGRGGKLTIDLAAVNFISSSFLGCLGDFVRDAALLRKRVKLTTTLDTSWLFEILGGAQTVELEVV